MLELFGFIHRIIKCPIYLVLLLGCTKGGSVIPASGVFDPPRVVVKRADNKDNSVLLNVVFRNNGDTRMRLLSLRTGCSCTQAAPLAKEWLSAGEATNISLSIQPPVRGEKNIRVDLLTDPPSSPGYLLIDAIGEPVLAPSIENAGSEVILQVLEGAGPAESRTNIRSVEVSGTQPLLTGVEFQDGGVAGLQIDFEGIVKEEPYLDVKHVRRTYGVVFRRSSPNAFEPLYNLRTRMVARETPSNDMSLSGPIVSARFVPMLSTSPSQLSWESIELSLSYKLLLLFATPDDWSVTTVSKPTWLQVHFEQLSNSRMRVVVEGVAPVGFTEDHLQFSGRAEGRGEFMTKVRIYRSTLPGT